MFKNFVVKPTERLIVLLDGSLHTVLNAGKHTIWHWGKEIETHKQDATVLHVQWNGIGSSAMPGRSIMVGARYTF